MLSTPSARPDGPTPPEWAVEQAADDLYDVDDPPAVVERAWQLAREAEDLQAERHDEYDDPDQGGEA